MLQLLLSATGDYLYLLVHGALSLAPAIVLATTVTTQRIVLLRSTLSQICSLYHQRRIRRDDVRHTYLTFL